MILIRSSRSFFNYLQEELLWYQKSHSRWIKLGDRNTKFFHSTTIIRRRHNRVEALKDDRGQWVDNPTELKTMAVEFFAKLYKEENKDYVPFTPKGMFPPISHSDIVGLGDPLTDDEIK